MVVLRVAHADRVVRRKSESLERGRKPRRLVDPGGKHHDCALVEDHLQLKSEIADRLEYRCLIGLPCRNDHTPHGQRLDRTLSQCFNKALRRPHAERLLLSCGGQIEQSAVFGHDVMEQIQPRANLLQVIKIATGDQQELAARGDQALECGDGIPGDPPVLREACRHSHNTKRGSAFLDRTGCFRRHIWLL